MNTTGSALLNPEAYESAACAAEAQDALKMEVAERLAAHRQRRSRQRTQGRDPRAVPSEGGEAVAVGRGKARSSRIAAVVAERYANSPSYRAFLEAEAERAIQEAQAAAEVAALNAMAVEQAQREFIDSLNSGVEASFEFGDSRVDEDPEAGDEVVCAEEFSLQPMPVPPAAKRKGEQIAGQPGSAGAGFRNGGLTVRLFDGSVGANALQAAPGRDFAMHLASPARRRESAHDAEAMALGIALDEEIAFRRAPVFEEPSGPTVALPANLIEFPRQLVAPRKARPRFAEGPLREEEAAVAGGSQLRIFEVDSAQISTTPEPDEDVLPQWSALWLDTPADGSARGGAGFDRGAQGLPVGAGAGREASLGVVVESKAYVEAVISMPRPSPAAISRRFAATAIDGCMILAAFAVFVVGFAGMSSQPAGDSLPRALATLIGPNSMLRDLAPGVVLGMTVACLIFFCLLYQGLFYTFASATPGMRLMRIAFCTFSDGNPSRRAMRRRVLAGLVAALPLGFGLLWAFVDEDRLGWHDRMSGMYRRSY